MVTSLYSLRRVSGAAYLVIGYLICVAVYLAVGLLFRQNRGKRGRRRLLLGLLVSEVLCDGVWFLAYYPGGEYHNYGIGAVAGAFLWPMLLVLAGVLTTKINSKSKE